MRKYSHVSRTERVVTPVIDPKEAEPPRSSCGWPDGVRFEDAERVERRTIQRVAPHVAERWSSLGNSSLLCVQGTRW